MNRAVYRLKIIRLVKAKFAKFSRAFPSKERERHLFLRNLSAIRVFLALEVHLRLDGGGGVEERHAEEEGAFRSIANRRRRLVFSG